MLKAVKKLSLQ